MRVPGSMIESAKSAGSNRLGNLADRHAEIREIVGSKRRLQFPPWPPINQGVRCVSHPLTCGIFGHSSNSVLEKSATWMRKSETTRRNFSACRAIGSTADLKSNASTTRSGDTAPCTRAQPGSWPPTDLRGRSVADNLTIIIRHAVDTSL